MFAQQAHEIVTPPVQQMQALHAVADCHSNDGIKQNNSSDSCVSHIRSYTYFDFELHHTASVPGVRADAGGLSGWTERTSRPDFVFERRCSLACRNYSIFHVPPHNSSGFHSRALHDKMTAP